MLTVTLLPALVAIGAHQDIERVRVVPAPVSLVLRRFEEATGWIKIGDDWYSADRRIGGSGNEGRSSLGRHEFRSLEWRTVEHENRKLPALVIIQTTGDYVYPTIKKDWATMPQATVLVFDTFPFVKKTAYTNGKPILIEADSIRVSGYDVLSLTADSLGVTSEKEIKEIIGKSVAKPEVRDDKTRFRMVIFPVDHEGKSKVRFLFETFNIKKRNDRAEQLLRRTFPNDYLEISPRALNSMYYESSLEAFRDFFAPLPE